jgi:Ca-activated chloride channel family protein
MNTVRVFKWMREQRRKGIVLVERREKPQARTRAAVLRWVSLTALTLVFWNGQGFAQRLIAWPVVRPPVVMPMPPHTAPPPDLRPAPDLGPVTGTPLPPDARILPMAGRAFHGVVRDQAAQLTMDVRFHNDTPWNLEGELLIPIPPDVVFEKMEMRVGDKVLHAELLDSEKARNAYETVVRQLRDPALLELVGSRLVRARVYPIPPRSEVRLSFSYAEVLEKQGNLMTLRLPMSHLLEPRLRTEQLPVALDFEASQPIRLLYSPTHRIEVERHGDRRAAVRYDGNKVSQDKDFVLLYSEEAGPLSTSVTVYKQSGESGYFLLSLDPKAEFKGTSIPKDVVFVIDRSGSMADNEKLDQAKKALRYCLSRLSPRDRFGVVDFATETGSFREELAGADPAAVRRAQEYVAALEPSGGTYIDGALEAALKMLHKTPGRLPVVVFLTDGQPTEGESNTGVIVRHFHEANGKVQARFFGFGVGEDVNALLIDDLANGERGSRDYVLPGEDLEIKISRLFDRISKPAITDVALEWKGVRVFDLCPRKISDIYHGDPLVLLGRYREEGKGTLRISGRLGDRAIHLEVPLSLPGAATENAFLPRLWAAREVAQLMDDVRLSGKDNPELAQEIAKLAKRFGILTPYTSFFIGEDADMARLRQQAAVGLQRMRFDAVGSPQGTSARAMIFSRNVQSMISGAAGSLGEGFAQAGSYSGASAPEEKPKTEIRSAGAKTFYRRDAAWVDAEYEMDKASYRPVEIAPFSRAYFDLLRRHPELAEYLSIGSEVVVVLEGKAYRLRAR